MRVVLVLLAAATVACATVAADGPCLAVVRSGRHHQLWKNGVTLGPVTSSLADATEDDPAAYSSAKRAIHEDRAALASMLTSVVSWWAFVGADVATSHRYGATLIGSGAAAALGGFATTVALAVASGRSSDAAIARYNQDCRR